MSMKFKFFDTCSLLEQADKLFQQDRDYDIVISSISLEELEHIKTAYNKDFDIKRAARRLVATMDEHYDEFEIIVYNSKLEDWILSSGFSLSNDMKIIACAKEFTLNHPDDEFIFVTDDLICRHIASMFFDTEKSAKMENEYYGYS